MSFATRSPVRMAGGVISSGHVDTGETRWTRGGERVATALSGSIALMSGRGIPITSGGHAFIVSGQGRVNTFLALRPINLLSGVTAAGAGLSVLSGQPIILYDAVMGQRSGIIADTVLVESGARPIYHWFPPLAASGIGTENAVVNTHFTPVEIDQPYFSGLCVMALSGAPGFTITYTPEAVRSGNRGEEAA
mgnify:CR=1 FL=1